MEAGVFDLAGRRVREPFACDAAGPLECRSDGADEAGRAAPDGLYLLWARAGPATFTRKLVRLQ